MIMDSTETNLNKLLTVQEAADILRLSAKRVHELVRLGLLGCVQVTARERRFTGQLIQDYIDSKTIIPPKSIDKKRVPKLPLPKGLTKITGGKRALLEEMRSW
jgi:hypothetical protein